MTRAQREILLSKLALGREFPVAVRTAGVSITEIRGDPKLICAALEAFRSGSSQIREKWQEALLSGHTSGKVLEQWTVWLEARDRTERELARWAAEAAPSEDDPDRAALMGRLHQLSADELLLLEWASGGDVARPSPLMTRYAWEHEAGLARMAAEAARPALYGELEVDDPGRPLPRSRSVTVRNGLPPNWISLNRRVV